MNLLSSVGVTGDSYRYSSSQFQKVIMLAKYSKQNTREKMNSRNSTLKEPRFLDLPFS